MDHSLFVVHWNQLMNVKLFPLFCFFIMEGSTLCPIQIDI